MSPLNRATSDRASSALNSPTPPLLLQMLQQAMSEEESKRAAAAAAAAAPPSAPPSGAGAAGGVDHQAAAGPGAGPPPSPGTVAHRPPLPATAAAGQSDEAALAPVPSATVASKALTVKAGKGFALEASAAVWRSLSRMWSDLLAALIQRGLQLTLLVLERYALWAREWADYARRRAAAGPAAERDAAADPPAASARYTHTHTANFAHTGTCTRH